MITKKHTCIFQIFLLDHENFVPMSFYNDFEQSLFTSHL